LKFIFRLKKAIARILIGYFIIVNSQFSVEAYSDFSATEHITLNTVRLGWVIIGVAIFDFILTPILESLVFKEEEE